jgi:hypothetical protein
LDTGIAVLNGTAQEIRQRADIQSFYLGQSVAA